VSHGCVAIALPLCVHPTNANGIICYDLSVSPDVLIAAKAEEVRRLVFTTSTELKEHEQRIPLKTIHINRCPAIAPLTTLTEDSARRLALDIGLCQQHMKRLQQASGIVEKIEEAYKSNQFVDSDDPDFMLYQGDFFGASDISVMAALRNADPGQLAGFEGEFQDPRLDEMLFRYRARNYPDLLDQAETERW